MSSRETIPGQYQNNNHDLDTPFGVKCIAKIYLVLAILFSIISLIIVPSYIFKLSEANRAEVLLQTFISWTIYYGMKSYKNWVIIFILICSYLGILTTSLQFIFLKANSGLDVATKFIYLIFIFFFGFQIFIFSKSSTKNFFKDKGTTLIS